MQDTSGTATLAVNRKESHPWHRHMLMERLYNVPQHVPLNAEALPLLVLQRFAVVGSD